MNRFITGADVKSYAQDDPHTLQPCGLFEMSLPEQKVTLAIPIVLFHGRALFVDHPCSGAIVFVTGPNEGTPWVCAPILPGNCRDQN
jgi:hypothetical protein